VKSVRWMVSYILVAVVGLGLAFVVSVRFMAPAHSQGAPASGDLPPEFMKEVQSTQVPPPAGQVPPPPAQTPAGQVPPPPTQQQPPQGQIPPPPGQQQQPAANQFVPQPPQQQVPQDNVGDGATATPAPIPTSHPDDYFYDPTGKRDPFKAFRAVVVTTGQKQTAALEPLQKFELDRLQIVGILWEVRTPRAMVRDPDGLVHTVVKNTRIGRNEGYVAAIREGEIVVIETRYDDGKPVREPRVLEFRK
jgi:type IV pilus assembly protein PilP